MNEVPHRTLLGSTTIRLAASYLVIIMVLSVAFSGVLYNASAHELGRQLPPASFLVDNGGDPGNQPTFRRFFERRIDQGRHVLAMRLIFLNLMVLAGGGLFSYYLARRTLEPIEESMEAQSRFVSDASHELRTPLTAIMTSNEVALRKPKLSTQDAKDVIASNLEEITKLKTLTDGLLNLSTQNHALVRQPTSLQSVVTEAMNRVLGAAQQKDITIEDTVPNITLPADESELTQVVTILLDNAIKFSPAKSTIKLQAEQATQQAQLRIQDNGRGIAAADLPHIFDRFYRADTARTKTETAGYGIGLSIAKQIIERHQGDLIVSSAPGKGSTFTIQLPLV